MRGVDEAMHRRVDRRRGAAAAVQAVVERRDHLVFAIDARDRRRRARAAGRGGARQVRLGERAEIAARTLHPQQLDGVPVTGSIAAPLADVLPPA